MHACVTKYAWIDQDAGGAPATIVELAYVP
jgi:hypothetical protein